MADSITPAIIGLIGVRMGSIIGVGANHDRHVGAAKLA
jgi:hypothetical protein